MNFKKSILLTSLAITSSFASADTLTIDNATDWGGSHANYPASNTIDNDLAWSSRWAAELGGDAVNLVLDLGSVQNITELGISWGKGADQTHSFEIWARASSSDSWTKVREKGDTTGTTSSIETYDIDAIDAQYIRIKTHSNSAGSDWTNIKEIEVYGGSSTEATDNALTINSIFDDGTGHSSYPASNANDGSSDWSSRWAAEAGGDAVNLTAQFDASQVITDVGVSWGQGDSRSHTFEIYARNATSGAWTKVYDGESSGNSTDIETYDVTDMDAQQVRLKVQSNTSGSNWSNVTEMKIYGGEGSDSGTNADIPSIITDGSLFDLEGDDPHPLVDSKTLEFVPLETQYTTSGGGGWRHEYKINTNDRISINNTYEAFSATYKMDLSNGAKTIVAQTHGSTISTLMKVFVADSSESGFGDSVASNGIFDVYVRLRGTDSDEVKQSLCTIESGESFDITYVNNYGTMTVSACGNSLSMEVEDDEASFFKFGNYMQSQDPETREECGTRGDSDSWAECFEEFGITTSKATVTNVSYSSNH